MAGFFADGRVAAKMGRLSWVVLVTAFVILLTADLSGAARDAALLGLIAVFLGMNFPTARGVIGLWRSGERSKPLRLLSVLLAVRAVALVIAVTLIRTIT